MLGLLNNCFLKLGWFVWNGFCKAVKIIMNSAGFNWARRQLGHRQVYYSLRWCGFKALSVLYSYVCDSIHLWFRNLSIGVQGKEQLVKLVAACCIRCHLHLFLWMSRAPFQCVLCVYFWNILYGYKSWTSKKHERILMLLNVWEDSWEYKDTNYSGFWHIMWKPRSLEKSIMLGKMGEKTKSR